MIPLLPRVNRGSTFALRRPTLDVCHGEQRSSTFTHPEHVHVACSTYFCRFIFGVVHLSSLRAIHFRESPFILGSMHFFGVVCWFWCRSIDFRSIEFILRVVHAIWPVFFVIKRIIAIQQEDEALVVSSFYFRCGPFILGIVLYFRRTSFALVIVLWISVESTFLRFGSCIFGVVHFWLVLVHLFSKSFIYFQGSKTAFFAQIKGTNILQEGSGFSLPLST